MAKKPIHEYLCDLLGSRKCYFEPPTGLKMDYPCIIYRLNGINSIHADNILYRYKKEYLLTYIDYDPDNKMVDKLIQEPYCRFDRTYFAGGLNHYVFVLYY